MSQNSAERLTADLHDLAEQLAAREDAAAEHPGAITSFRRVRPEDVAHGGKDFRGMMDYVGDVAFDKRMGEQAATARALLDSLKDYARNNHTIYRYYSTQRPVDIGTFPKTAHGPVRIKNFDERVPVEGGAFRAWGVLLYDAPLTQKQMDDYELRPAPDNRDRQKAPPTIDQQLAQAKREADKQNAARPAPPKEKDNDSR